ncbi:hypothetical protein AUJ84_00540 [Candidatus Pacearchaeota archaeon CG1_02_32_132]|nr:MAG: hypothetical protein AUJ84_00540 [Candidatus Pacearchaeota archaeon CG1_02_32_132]
MVINKQAKTALYSALVFSLTLSVLFLMSFVFASIGATTVGGQTNQTFTVLDDTNPTLNITLNSSLTGGANYTPQIYIVLDRLVNYSFADNSSIGTNAVNSSGGTGTVQFDSVILTSPIIGSPNHTLNFSGLSLAAGDSNKKNFWFNITTNSPGKGLNISIVAYNNTIAGGNGTSEMNYNITLNINDTWLMTFTAPSIGSGGYRNIAEIPVNITITGNETYSNVSFLFYNSSGKVFLTNTTVLANAAGANGAGVHFFNLSSASSTSSVPDGIYYYNVTVNNTQDDHNVTVMRNVTIDTVAPTYTLTRNTASTKTQLVIDIAVSDSTAGVNGTCSLDNSEATVVRSSDVAQQITQTGLLCGTSYSYTINCVDRAANAGVNVAGTFSTDSCSSDGASGGSESSSSSGTWTSTYADDSKELSVLGSVSRDLGAKQRMRLKVAGEEHYVGVKSLTGTSAVIEIASTPQEYTFNVGDVKKFDVDGDGFYDMSVTLGSIASAKAMVKVSPIHEVVSTTEEKAKEESKVGGEASGETSTGSSGLSSGAWIGIIILLIAVIAVVVYFVRKK